ncbi:hypothetical protein [Paraburkholderia phenazinium]|uniref:hypothetical protein n=1 Tax=Paraburkholderia phenazinium TaxID=60549 RepID=UPI000B89A478|nr:hypothetical protein [Paraburkholderia phenazinium]
MFRRAGIAFAALQLSACSWFSFLHPAPDTQHAAASLGVAPASEFVYMPARNGQISANRIENTAMTAIVLKTNIDEAVRNSVAHQMQLAGFNAANPGRVLSGRIEAFSVNDARAPAVWTLKVHYVVREVATQRVVYASTKTVRLKCAKFTNVKIALDDTVKLSVEALVGDTGFAKAVE